MADTGHSEEARRSNVDELFAHIVAESADTREQGTLFERLVQWFLTNDPSWLERITQVWLWNDAPEELRKGHADTGIDLVGLDEDGVVLGHPSEMLHGEETVREGRVHVLHERVGR